MPKRELSTENTADDALAAARDNLRRRLAHAVESNESVEGKKAAMARVLKELCPSGTLYVDHSPGEKGPTDAET